MGSQVILVDGKNFCYRHHWTHRSLESNGFPTSVLYGATQGLLSLAKRIPETPFVFVWDGFGKTWRHELAASVYKANRILVSAENHEDIDNLHKQLPLFKEFTRRIGLRNFEIAHLEGDDLIGILVTHILKEKLFDKVIIHSTDKDFYQFIDKRVSVLKNNQDGKLRWAAQKEIEESFGVTMPQWTKFRAITGDPTDNIQQMFKNVGGKTAAKFVCEGIDPAVPLFEKLPRDVQKRFSKPFNVRGTTVDFPKVWSKLHTNYHLCQIVRSHKDQHLSEQVAYELKQMLSKLTRKSFLRNQKKLTDDGWFYMTSFMATYELAELMHRREELWRLP